MSDNRATQVGKQAIWETTSDNHVTQVGKAVVFPVHNAGLVTQIGKQVVWSDVAPPTPPPPTQVAPAPVLARGGTLYVDSALEYDGRNVATPDGLFPGVSVALSGGSTWLPGETLTLTASTGVFGSGDVGNVLVLHQTDSVTAETITTVRFTIAGFTSTAIVTGTADITIPTPLRSGSIIIWDRLVDAVSGLDHIEGEAVGILGDEHVIASPNNARLPIVTVSSGTVALGDFYARVVVGLPYISDLETLDVDTPQGASIKGQNVDVTRVGLFMEDSRSIWVGSVPPTNDAVNPLESLEEVPMPTDPLYETGITDYVNTNVPSTWTTGGRMFARSVDPVAARILAIYGHGYVPGPG